MADLDQQVEESAVVVLRKTPPGEAPNWGAFGADMHDGKVRQVRGGPLDYDLHVKRFRNSASARALVGEPQAVQPAPGPGSGEFQVLLLTTGGYVDFTSFEVVSTAGFDIKRYARGDVTAQVQEAYRANYLPGEPVPTPTAVIRAQFANNPQRWVTWTITAPTTGTKVVSIPAPKVVSQPQNRTFAEAEGREFDVPVGSFFDAPDVPAVYEVLNGDTSALTNFTIVSTTGSGAATVVRLKSPTGASVNGVFNVMFRVTDNSGRSVFTVAQYDVQADPAPQVIGGITSRTIGIGQSGSFDIDAANVFSDNGSLVYTVDQSNGSALPAGYSFAVNGTVVTINYPTEVSANSYTFRLNAQESGGQQRYARATFGMTRSAASTVVTTAAPIVNPEAATTPFQVNLTELTKGCPTVSITDDLGDPIPNRFNVVQIVNGLADVEATYANNEIVSDNIHYNGTPWAEPLTVNDDTAKLTTAGWAFGTGWGVGTGDGFGGGNSLYSTNANQTAEYSYRPSGSLSYSGQISFAVELDAGKTGTIFQLRDDRLGSGNEVRLEVVWNGTNIRVFGPYINGDSPAPLPIDVALAGFDTGAHLLRLTWDDVNSRTAGYIKLESGDGSGNWTLIDEFTGDTNPFDRDPNLYLVSLKNDVRYSRLNTDAPNVQVNTTWQSAHNPPVPATPQTLIIQADSGPVVIDAVAQSDDLNNVIVNGSVSADFGAVSATSTEITYTPAVGYEGDDTIYYTLQAPDSGPTAAGTWSVNVQGQQANPPTIQNISTSSVDGTTAAAINLMSFVSGGDGGALPSSFQFVDLSTGQRLGRSRTISGIGTFNITFDDATNVATLTPTFVSGYVGTIPLQGIAVTDRAGNVPDDGSGGEDFIEWTHTQLADTGNPPPPQGGSIEPNVNDGYPLTLLCPSQHQDWVGENIYKNRVHYYQFGDPVTGVIHMNPGDADITLCQLVPNFKNGFTNIDQGEHVVKYTVVPNTGAGGAANTCSIDFPGGVESGSSGNVVRKTRTVGSTDTGNINLIASCGANGGDIIVEYIGHVDYENDTDLLHPNYASLLARPKIFRPMNWIEPNGCKIMEMRKYLADGDYRFQLDTNKLGDNVPVDDSDELVGYQYGPLFSYAVASNASLWINVPPTLGAKVAEAEIRVTKSNPADYDAYVAAVTPLTPQILAEAEIEYRLCADRIAASAIAQSYPDNRVLFIELGNEPWNTGSRAFKNTSEYFNAIGGYFSGDRYDLGTGYGRVSAIMARAFKERFAIHKPNQQIVFCLNIQTGTGTTRNRKMRDAWNAYNATVSGGASLLDCFYALTSYLQGGWQWNNNKSPGSGNPFGSSTEAEFYADFQAAHQANEAACFATIRDWYLNPTSGWKSISQVVNFHDVQLADAIANGVGGIIQYEGFSYHDIGDGLVSAYPGAAQAWKNWMASTYSRDVLRELANQMRAINPTNPARTSGWRPTESILANYQDIHREFNHSKPWVTRTPDQIATDLTDHAFEAWSEILRGSAGAPPPPPSPPPVTLLDEDFSVNDSIAKLGAAGWTMSGNDWQIETQDGGKNVLRGTSGSNNAQYSFRQSLQANPYLTLEMRLASATGGRNYGTIMRVIEQARGARFELWNPSGQSEITVSYPYIPGVSSQGTLFTTGPGSNPAWASVGDIQDANFKTLRFILEPNLVRLEIWNGSAFVTAGEATTNLDPNGVNGIWHALDLRYDRWFSHFKDLTP